MTTTVTSGHGKNEITTTVTEEVFAYLHADHLDTPRLATDETGTVVWRWDGNSFGSLLPNEDPDGDGTALSVHLRFPGQYYDTESGLHYNWNRYYNPEIGRYITSDPIGLDGGLNTYGYVSQNPLVFVDPYGLVDIVDLTAGVIDFSLSTGEAIAGVGIMILSTGTGPGAAVGYPGGALLAMHGISGMYNAAIDVENACYGTDKPGIAENIGGSLMGESGAKLGATIDLFTGVRPLTIVSRGPETVREAYDVLSASKSMGDAFSKNEKR